MKRIYRNYGYRNQKNREVVSCKTDIRVIILTNFLVNITGKEEMKIAK